MSAVDSESGRPTSRGDDVAGLRQVYAEWGRGNFRPRFDVYADDMVWGWSEEFPGLRGVSSDTPEEGSRRLREWLSQWKDWRCEAEEFIATGDFVVVLARYTGHGKESDVAVDSRGAHLWTMRDGKAIRLEVFSSRSKALEAARLPE